MDPLAQFKEAQKQGWAHFVPLEVMTTPPAARLIRHARVRAGQRVLDVACGTGVAAITARRAGASVVGLDLTPQLLARARENAQIADVDIEWHEGDVEALPFPDASFDVVLSQYGHMFAPRPDVASSKRSLPAILTSSPFSGASTAPSRPTISTTTWFGRVIY